MSWRLNKEINCSKKLVRRQNKLRIESDQLMNIYIRSYQRSYLLIS
jgi:hypothetical protein